MHLTAVRWTLAIGFGLASASSVLAQFGVARLSHANGAVTRLHREAPAATTTDVSLMDGDQIATAEGRAEITFHDGTTVHADKHTRLIVNAGERIQVLDGRLLLRTSGLKPYVAETSAGKLRVMPAGQVEVVTRAENRDVQMRVIAGWTKVESPWGSEQVTAYHTAIVSGPTSRPVVTQWVPTQSDEFERWASTRTIMANSRPIAGTDVAAVVAYAPYYGGWYYSTPAYVYYPGYPVYVSPYYTTPYYTTPYYTPTYVSPYYSRSYGSYYPYSYSYSYPGYREIYQWRTPERSSPTPTYVVPRPGAPPAGGAVSGVRVPK